MHILRKLVGSSLIMSSLALSLSTAALADAVTIRVNGTPMISDQPPVERAGRVYVPMRAIFERLGAGVVFGSGVINATGGKHTVSLTIGSSHAVIDHQPQELDSPPFLIGNRAMVPLRFISQALGADVDYLQSSRTILVTQGDLHERRDQPISATPIHSESLQLLRIVPINHETVASAKPEISATFAHAVDPNSVHIEIDGRDVSHEAYLSEKSFVFDPESSLPYGPHEIRLLGLLRDGRPFRSGWTFVTQAPIEANFLHIVSPKNGTHIGNSFVIEGSTRPRSRVDIVTTSSAAFEGFHDVTEGVAEAHVLADTQGAFIARIGVVDQGAEVVDVRLHSTAPDHGSVTRTLRLRP